MKENVGELMIIQQFEKSISKVILKRGKDYFQKGAIYELEQVAGNAWRAVILGTDQYFVYVELADERIAVSQCDCPFDGTCKHEVAVYFAIREALNTKSEIDYKILFNQFKKQELVEFLADIVANDPVLQKRFAPTKKKETVNTELLITQTKNVILKLFNSYLRTYNESALDKAFDQIRAVTEQAAKLFSKEPIIALELITLCIEQVASVEDSLPMWISEQMHEDLAISFFDLLDQATTNDEAIRISNWLLQRFEHNAKANITHLFLLDGAIQISAVSNAKYHIIDAIERYAKYKNDEELAQRLHFSLLMEVGVEAEITKFIHQEHIHAKLREMLIDYCVSEKRFEEALQLCADGIEEPGVSHYYRTGWLRQAYNVHKKMNNIAAQRTIAFELALDCNLDDITNLKALYQQESELWQEVAEELVLMIEQRDYDSYQYPLVLEMLGEWERLLYYCQQNPQAILRYCQSLQPHYQSEVGQLLTQLLLEKSNRASNRSHYRELANILERLFVLGYEEMGQELIHYLRTTYPRKTALHDVLNDL